MNKEIKKIALVAGGTGGHIFPAISLAKWIEKYKEGVSVIFFCGNRPLEQNIYSSHGIIPIILPIKGSPFFGSLREKLKRSINMVRAFFNAFAFLREEKPDFCLVFGGYISFPVYLAAKLRSIPVALHEQNACAGSVTRFLERFNEAIFTGFKICIPLSGEKISYTGIPVREFNLVPKDVAISELGLPSEIANCRIILVLTGSLGSETIKDKLLSLASDGKFCDVQFVLPATSEKLEKYGDNIWLLPKIWRTALLFSIADAIIARAGGSSLAEIGLLKIPAIIIPWKGAKDNHQYYNACEFVKENTAFLLDENEIKERLEGFLSEILQKNRLAISCDGQETASSKVYNKIINMIKNQSSVC